MEISYHEAKYKGSISLGEKVHKLPDKVGVVTTIQFVDNIKDIAKEIEEAGKEAVYKRGYQKYKGQVLGCDASAAYVDDADAYLYIGTGRFHPINVALKTGKEVYTFNPISGEFKKLPKKEIDEVEKKKRTAYMKYLKSKKIGILVSTKLGQSDLKKALELKDKLDKEGKEGYVFIDNDINYQNLENFPFIEAWVNTACPRLMEDFSVVNIEDIKNK